MAATGLKQYKSPVPATCNIADCLLLLFVRRNRTMQPVVSSLELHSSDTRGHFFIMLMQIQAHWG